MMGGGGDWLKRQAELAQEDVTSCGEWLMKKWGDRKGVVGDEVKVLCWRVASSRL